MIPLAIGFNIDFVTMFTHLNPHIFFGGDNVKFWGPLSWTMIFGILFGTFLTLLFVPVMYLVVVKFNERMARLLGKVSGKPAESLGGSEHLALDK